MLEGTSQHSQSVMSGQGLLVWKILSATSATPKALADPCSSTVILAGCVGGGGSQHDGKGEIRQENYLRGFLVGR